MQATSQTDVPPSNADVYEKLNELIGFFAERGKSADGMSAMLLGTLPMLKLQMRKVDPNALTWLSGFLGDAFARIGNSDMDKEAFATWLSALSQDSE